MKTNLLKKLVGTSVALPVLALALAGPVAALDETTVRASNVPSEKVSYKRSELTTSEGRARVEQRIRRAAEDVCGHSDYRRSGSLHVSAKREECYDRAVDAAMSQIGADQVATTD
ncbi:UrcA family protein [Haliea sp. E17]|uniref:UrcA family protein n=1 Tax=Haliea sp. E17 TaxID=3401576 RepID=UPI003AAE175A